MKTVVSKWWLCLLLGFLPIMQAKADSPLTSTKFYTAYENQPNFPNISSQNLLSFLEYITNTDNRLDYRLALINKDGWNFKGMKRSLFFIDYLVKMKHYKSVEDFYLRADGGLLICYAYLKAMDDYFDVRDALLIANMAATRTPESYAVQIIRAIIDAQLKMDTQPWHTVFEATDYVRQNEELLEDDFLPEAKAIIFEYMDLYKD